METNNAVKKESSCIPLRFKPYFYDVLDSDFDAVCEVIANKGAALKELVNLFEKEGEWRDIILPIVYYLHLISAFHHLFDHTKFAIIDYIY